MYTEEKFEDEEDLRERIDGGGYRGLGSGADGSAWWEELEQALRGTSKAMDKSGKEKELRGEVMRLITWIADCVKRTTDGRGGDTLLTLADKLLEVGLHEIDKQVSYTLDSLNEISSAHILH